MNYLEAKQNRERLDQMDSNIYVMAQLLKEKTADAKEAGNTEAAAAYDEIVTMVEHVKDDADLKKLYKLKG